MSITPTPGPAHIFLHIGTMKTGTSYLQQMLERNTEILARDGAIYANGGGGMHRAIVDALGLEEEATDGPWSRIVQISQEHRGSRVIISNELISFADDERAKRIVESFHPNPVTVIITARDLVKLLPSAWQNKIKHGKAWLFTDYVDSVIGESGPRGATRSFWRHHDLGTIVRRWVAAAGADHVVVIPVPGREAGRDALWGRFTAVTGLDATGYDLTEDRKSNLSLGYAETELLRHVNRRLQGHADWPRQRKVIQRLLANEVLRPDPGKPVATERPSLTPTQHAWAATRSRELADEVAATGVRVEGDLAELVPDALTEAEKRAALASAPSEPPEMVIEVIAALVARLVEVAEFNDADEPADGAADDELAELAEHDERQLGPGRAARPAVPGGRKSRAHRRSRARARAAAKLQRGRQSDPDLAEELENIES